MVADENPVGFLVGQVVVSVEDKNGTYLTLGSEPDGAETGHVSAPVWRLRLPDGRIAVEEAWDMVSTPEHLDRWRAALVRRSIRAARVEGGGLELVLSDESVLSAHPHQSYEAWEAGVGAHFVVCVPGGELAIWEFRDRT